jgi:peptide/nickel transport system substrate-binding protein
VANTDVSSLVGTGPYRLTRFAPGQQAVFERNPNYSGAKAKNDQLIIKYYSKSSTMKLALQQGAIDMAFRDFTPTEYTALGRTKGIKLYRSSGALIRYIVLHQKRAPTDKPAVRQALAYLIPRQVLAARIYHDQVSPLYSTVPAGLPGHIDAFAARYGTAPNPTKAKAVLQRAGLTTPVPLTLWWTPSHYGDSSADEYAEIQRALNTSGLFKVTLKSAEWTTYAKTLGTQYGAFQLGWFPDYPDAEDYLAPLYSTASNFFSNGYSNPAMDATLKKEAAAKSTAQRLQYLSQAQTIAAKDVPIIPYAQAAMLVVARSNVHGVSGTLDATYNMRFWMLSKS